MSDLTARLVPEEAMHDIRERLAAEHPDAFAVVVLSGSEQTGLAMSVSSAVSEKETLMLLGHAILAEQG